MPLNFRATNNTHRLISSKEDVLASAHLLDLAEYGRLTGPAYLLVRPRSERECVPDVRNGFCVDPQPVVQPYAAGPVSSVRY